MNPPHPSPTSFPGAASAAASQPGFPGQKTELPRSEPNRDTAAGERDSRGRFTANNKGGPGNPFARRTAALRQAMLDAVSPEDLQAIVRGLIEKAKEGDVAAARLVLSYTVGKPDKAVDPDTLDQQEWQQWQQSSVANQELTGLLGRLQAPLALTILRAALPSIQEATAQELAGQLNTPQAEPEPVPTAKPSAGDSPLATGDAAAAPGGRMANPSHGGSSQDACGIRPMKKAEDGADREFLESEQAAWLEFLRQIAAPPFGEEPAEDDEGRRMSGLPRPPSANGSRRDSPA